MDKTFADVATAALYAHYGREGWSEEPTIRDRSGYNAGPRLVGYRSDVMIVVWQHPAATEVKISIGEYDTEIQGIERRVDLATALAAAEAEFVMNLDDYIAVLMDAKKAIGR